METLLEKVGKVIQVMANNQMAKDRFDIGEGYKELDYREMLYLERLLSSSEPTIIEHKEAIQSKLNHIKNQYL